MADSVPRALLATIERNRRRVWAVCYRMTGNRADADDLSQEAIARAIERADQIAGEDPTGWLLRLTTRLCIDHLRHREVRRRLTELVDPLCGTEWTVDADRPSADNLLVLREDIRFAIVVALQSLSPRQRAALVLRDVCGLSLTEVALALDSNDNAVKALLQRARVALAQARHRTDGDVPADASAVERFAEAIRSGSVDRISALFADDVWGVADGGGIVVTAKKPTFGRATVAKQWANAQTKLGGAAVTAEVLLVNGEPAILIRLAGAPDVIVALVHLETRAGLVTAQRVLRDPLRLRGVRSPSDAQNDPPRLR